MDYEAWNKFIKLHGSLELKIWWQHVLWIWGKNLECFLKFILGILYIFLKVGNSGVQRFKRCANRSWNEEVMTIWRQLRKVERPFRNDFEIQLMNSKWPQFWIHPLQLWCFAYLGNWIGHSICLLWVPHKLEIIILLFFFSNF